jgi:8-oxo-dGTP pyrophosphatase MutT (NUDIX family)
LADLKEIGVIPYTKKNNSFRFVIVTTRGSSDHWIFPKGRPEEDKSDVEVAGNEAFEEAGIIGRVKGKPYKVTLNKNGDKVTYKFYPFKVSRVCRKWPERKQRRRSFVKAPKALKKLKSKPYEEALRNFISSFS